jgi:hypothetical protein
MAGKEKDSNKPDQIGRDAVERVVSETGLTLSQADLDNIADEANASMKKLADDAVRKQNISAVSDSNTSVPKEAIQAIVDKYSFNINGYDVDDDKIEKMVLEIKAVYPTAEEDAIMEAILEKMGKSFGTQMAMMDAAETGKLPVQEEVDRLGKMFTKMILAEERGEEPDMSEFRIPVSQTVDTAVEKYAASERVTSSDNLHSRLYKVKQLFEPHPGGVNPDNLPYRFLARKATCKLNDHGISFSGIFTEQRDYRKRIDGPEVEKMVRRLDTEVRGLDPIARDEMIFNFVSQVLETDSINSLRGWSISQGHEFTMLSESSRKVLRDLVMFYFYTKAAAQMSAKGHLTVNQKFDKEVLDCLVAIQHEHTRRGFHPESMTAIRYVAPSEYKDILCLSKALYNALPDAFRDTVEAAMWLNAPKNPDIVSSNSNQDTIDASKYLRNAFIAVTQGRGSFENFATAVIKYYELLDEELNHKVEIASYMVGLYDALNLKISDVLRESEKRILEVPMF